MADLLSEERLAEFNEAFGAFDKKGEKKIPAGDLITVFQAMKCNISKKEEQEYLSLLDPNGEGSVPHAEMLPLIAKRLETRETTDMLVAAFRVFDKQNRGTISPEELRHILSHFGELMDTNEVDEYIAEADIKCPDLKANGEKTGNINYLAFVGVVLDLTEDEVMAAGLAVPPRL